MKKTREGLTIDEVAFDALVENLQIAMDEHDVPFRAKNKRVQKLRYASESGQFALTLCSDKRRNPSSLGRKGKHQLDRASPRLHSLRLPPPPHSP